MGSGKTLIAIKYLLSDYLNGRKIFSNTPLFKIEYEDFDIEKFLSNNRNYRDKLKNATIFVDEITVFMDCRLSGSKQNLLMGYMVLQSRKRHVDIYYTTQDLDLVDYKRLVKYTKILIHCQKLYYKDKTGDLIEVEDIRRFTIIDLRKQKDNAISFEMDITPFYKYYDTDYIIEPLITWTEKK